MLQILLWHWSGMRRPYVVYQGGNIGIAGVCDLLPGWLAKECVYKDLCQCHLVGLRPQGWHRPGALYSNIVCRRSQLFERPCGLSHVGWKFLIGCNERTKNVEIAIKLSRVVMHVLTDVPPSVPPRDEPLVFVFTSRERKPKWERARLRGIKRRYLDKIYRGDCRVGREMKGYVDERDGCEYLRRRVSRSALVRLSAPKGGGIGHVFVARVAVLASIVRNCGFGVYFFEISRNRASQRVGFVSIPLIMLRLDLTHTRLNGLRAANSSLPVGVLFVASVSLSSFLLCLVHLSRVSRWVRLARRGMFMFDVGSLLASPSVSCLPLTSVFGVAPVLSSSSRPLSSWAGRLPLPLCLLCVCLAPPVSRPLVILFCSDHVQLSLPVNLCVRELRPPLSILNRGLWHAW